MLASGGERRDTKRRVGRRRELPFTVIWENKTASISFEILISAMCFMEQKNIFFRFRTDISDELARSELARPGPVMTLFDGLFLKCVTRFEL